MPRAHAQDADARFRADVEKLLEVTGALALGTQIVGIHMKHFTHDEVMALLDFYGTAVGRKSISVMPTLAQEGAAAGQEWAAAHLPQILGAIDERLRAEGFLKR